MDQCEQKPLRFHLRLWKLNTHALVHEISFYLQLPAVLVAMVEFLTPQRYVPIQLAWIPLALILLCVPPLIHALPVWVKVYSNGKIGPILEQWDNPDICICMWTDWRCPVSGAVRILTAAWSIENGCNKQEQKLLAKGFREGGDSY